MNQTIQDLGNLEYLHDARLAALVWDYGDRASRNVFLFLAVDSDTAFEPWRGKKICLKLLDVVAAKFVEWGHMSGEELIDSWRTGVEPQIEAEWHSMLSMGISVPHCVLL